MNEALYHMVPEMMRGNLLLPLNDLKFKFPDVYMEQIKKYAGRERILNRRVPILDCLWNDVLHTTAIEPSIVKDVLIKVGLIPPNKQWFKIPISRLDQNLLVTYWYRNWSAGDDQAEYERFDASHMNSYRIIPDATIEYYKSMKSEGKRPLLFHLVPHILYKGSISTDGLEVISWN